MKLTKIEKALVYVRYNYDIRLMKDEIEIGGHILINAHWYKAVLSKNGKFLPVAFTSKVENFYKTVSRIEDYLYTKKECRKKKLHKISNL